MDAMRNRGVDGASDTGRDAGDSRDRHELPAGEVPGAAADRADEGQPDSVWATDGAGGRATGERGGTDRRLQAASSGRGDGRDGARADSRGRGGAGAVGGDAGLEPRDSRDECAGGGAGAARDSGDGHDTDRDWRDSQPAQELGVAADRPHRAAPSGVGGTDSRRDSAAGSGAAAAGVARGQPVGTGGGGDASRPGESGHGAVGPALEECRSASPGLSISSSSCGAGEYAGGRSRDAARSPADAARTTPAASSSNPTGSDAANAPAAAAGPGPGRPGDPGRRDGIDEIIAVEPGGGARFRKRARQLKEGQRAERDDQIRSLLAQGHRNKAIARKLTIDVKTVRRVKKGAKKAKPRSSKLDAFKPVIQELVVKKDLTATRVLREIRALGYAGGYSVLKEYVRSIRRRSRRRPHLRFETDKGTQGQVDLSGYTVDFRGQATDVVCFSMVFGYSRWQFIRFTEAANAHSVCHSHGLAFEKAGGVPHEMLYDRMKQVVLESYADRVVFHPLFEALAKHYGFKPIPLAPGYKEGKGKVENPFKYVLSDLLKGSTFHALEDLNRKAEAWLRELAWVRKHGTTQERPLDRMDEELPFLMRLPPRPFVAARVEERLARFGFFLGWGTHSASASP